MLIKAKKPNKDLIEAQAELEHWRNVNKCKNLQELANYVHYVYPDFKFLDVREEILKDVREEILNANHNTVHKLPERYGIRAKAGILFLEDRHRDYEDRKKYKHSKRRWDKE